jgi:hypothetical protein
MPTYLAILFCLVLMAVLIAGYFYLPWVKARDGVQPRSCRTTAGIEADSLVDQLLIL